MASAVGMQGLALEAPLSERAFLKSEVGLSWEHVSSEVFVDRTCSNWSQGHGTNVIVSNPGPLLNVLPALPHGSLRVLLLSDEDYREDVRSIADSPQVATLIRNYSVSRISTIMQIKASLEFVREALPHPAIALHAPLLLTRGVRRARRVARWESAADAKSLEAPLGYTDAFAAQYRRLNATSGEGESLIGVATPPADSARAFDYVFLGQAAQAQRRLGLTLAARLPRSKILVNSHGWSGHGDDPSDGGYVKMLMNSRFALCPPGWACNESFRITEALICGALPVGLSQCLTQGTRSSLIAELGVFEDSWTNALERTSRINEEDRVNLVENGRSALRKQTESLRAALQLR